MKKKKYEAPQTKYLELELEQGLMVKGSIVDNDKETKQTISITPQEVGNESDYFNDENAGWDF